MYTLLFDLGQKSQDIIFNRKLRSSKPCQGLMSSCFPWESVAPSAFAIPVGHLCQRAIWGDSGFGVQDMCFWYLFGRPSWWSLGIVLLQPFFQLGIRQRRGKKWSTPQFQTSKGVKWASVFVFPTGSFSRLIHLSIVRAIWTIEVAKKRSFFDSLKCISLSHWLVMAINHVCHCWSQEAWVIYMQRWGTWHMSGQGLTHICRACAPGFAQAAAASTACEPCDLGHFQEDDGWRLKVEGEGIKADEEMDLQNCKTSFFYLWEKHNQGCWWLLGSLNLLNSSS